MYILRHPQKLNCEKFVEWLSMKILILENFYTVIQTDCTNFHVARRIE